MQIYHIYQWLLFFYIYCFVGWVWESTYVSIRKRRFVNRGFLYGPWIPLYGTGWLVMLVCALPLKDNLFLVYISGMFGATLLELVTGLAMEKIFKVKYWDYSNQKIQFKGYICLSSSLFWGLLAVLVIKWVHAPFERLVLAVPRPMAIAFVIVLSILFVVDVGFSIKTALDMRRILVALERIHEEMEQAQKQLADKMEQSRQQVADKLEQGRQQWTDKWDQGRLQFESQLEEKVASLRERKELQMQKLHRANEKLLKRHPSASHLRTDKKLADLKKRLEEWDLHVHQNEEKNENEE